ncbi:MAG: O-antigen ligase family protein [Methylovirgula sp.]
MSAVYPSSVEREGFVVPGWAPAVVLLLATAAVGPSLGGGAKFIFIGGCAGIGWYAWRRSAGAHLQSVLLLYVFAPFVRRLIDVRVGFDPSGLMLVGPLLATAVPAVSLIHLIKSPYANFGRQLGPIILVGLCVVYAAIVTIAQGDWTNAASGLLKWMVPLLYAAVLAAEGDVDELIEAATSAFMVILPIIGLYGIYQYVNPPEWDRYWMQLSSILSVGEPVPYGVRVFSTMNSPASFATFMAAGLLLIGFLRSGWLPALVTAPAVVGLMLSLYRTAWISLALGMVFCLFFLATRKRGAIIMIVMVVAAVLIATASPFADTIGDRLQTLGQGSQDGSAQERLLEYVALWTRWDSSLFGIGFTTTDVGTAGAMAVDGMIVFCWLSMGIIVGLACIAGFLWAIWNVIAIVREDPRPQMIVIGALACGALVQLPLANIGSGELGFLFWTFAALAAVEPPWSRALR